MLNKQTSTKVKDITWPFISAAICVVFPPASKGMHNYNDHLKNRHRNCSEHTGE